MEWSEIRTIYPDQWLIIEALEAYTDNRLQRIIDKIAIIEKCADGQEVLNHYRRWHLQFPGREFYFVHTSRERLDIRERVWVGIRRNHAVASEG